MSPRYGMPALKVALGVSLLMLLSFTGIAAAGSSADTTVCAEGYVINHRELAVDATELATGLSVEAVNSAGQSAFAHVDGAGYFKFEELQAGEWSFRLQLPESWEGIVPYAERGGVAGTGITRLDAQSGCVRIVFKIRRLFDLTVLKWEELLDGTVQPGADWEITATPVQDPFVQSQTETTDGAGRVHFALTPGRWIVSEKVKPGWKPLVPTHVTLELNQYDPPGAINPVVFKNQEPACTSGIVVEKIGFGRNAQGNEIRLGPLAGWQIIVARADSTRPPITKVTDGSGLAVFEGLAPGVYNIYEHMQVGWESTEDNPVTVIHRNCESTEVVFRNTQVTGELRIHGYKLLKAWESPFKGHPVGLSGWAITATLVGTDIMTRTVTNALGEYLFSQETLVAAGMGFPGATIEVCEEDRDTWIHLTPKCATVHFPYPLPANYAGARVDFTNVQYPPAAILPTITRVTGCRAVYTVQGGDTLARIAASYGTTVAAIARLHGIRDVDYIRTGQVFCIP